MAKQHGGNVWQAQKTYGLQTEQILDFSANINPLGPSPRALEAIKKALLQIHHYPEPQAETLCREIAGVTGISEENLILGNGAAELIYALGRVLKPRRVLIPAPAFSEYAEGFMAYDKLEIPLNPSNNFSLSEQTIAPLLQTGDLLIICNPNNPTGQLVAQEHLNALLLKASEVDASILIDEAFMDFVTPEQSLLKQVQHAPHLLVLRSLTKFFAVPGLRLGYLAAAKPIIESLRGVLPPWRVNLLAQVAGIASLQDQEYITATLELINQQKSWLATELAALGGLRPLPGAANFILIDSRASGATSEEIQNFLGPKGILIRLCNNFVGLDDYYFRVAVRSEKENLALIEGLKEFLQ